MKNKKNYNIKIKTNIPSEKALCQFQKKLLQLHQHKLINLNNYQGEK